MTRTRSDIRRLTLLGLLVAVAVGLFVPAGSAAVPETANESTDQSVDLTVWTAPVAEFDSFDAPRDVHAAMDDGTLTRNRTIAHEDAVVFAVESARMVDALQRERDAGGNDTDAFRDLARSDAFAFETTQVDMETNPDAPRLNLTATARADGLRVVPDASNGTLYVAVKSDRAVLDTWVNRSMLPGKEFRTAVAVDDSTARASVEWRVVERTLEFESPVHGDRLVFGVESPCHRLAGRTSVAPGTDLAIRMVASAEYRPLETTAVVDPDGRFETTLDTSESYPSNESVDVTVAGVRPDITEGVFGHDGGPVGLSTVRLADQQSNGSAVVVERATIGEGGFVALYPASVADDIATRASSGSCSLTRIDRDLAAGNVLGVSDYLSPGWHEDVSVRLDSPLDRNRSLVAVVHPDTNDNATFDFPPVDPQGEVSNYPAPDDPAAVNGSLVSDRGLVRVVTPASNRTTPPERDTVIRPTTESTPTDSPTPPTTADATAEPTAGTTPGDGPGFTAGIAVLALLALTLLARRRS